MLILPLKCRNASCGYRVEIYSSDPMPVCPKCHGKLGPGGPAREAKENDQAVACAVDAPQSSLKDGLIGIWAYNMATVKSLK